MRVLITGGAGFVGSALARHFRRQSPQNAVVVLDNLRRRGSERNQAELVAQGVTFAHGDVRNPADLDALEGNFDVLIEASAEPSVQAGIGGSPRYVLDTNLLGAMNCLEFARNRCGGLVFLSSSRVYSIAPLTQLPLEAMSDPPRYQQGCRCQRGQRGRHRRTLRHRHPAVLLRRFETGGRTALPGIRRARRPVHRDQPLRRDRGPGPVRQDRPGGLHAVGRAPSFRPPAEVHGVRRQGAAGARSPSSRRPVRAGQSCSCSRGTRCRGRHSMSAADAPGRCRCRSSPPCAATATGREAPIDEDPATNAVDIPWYISDHAKITRLLGWSPRRGPAQIVQDIAAWVRANEEGLSGLIV